MATEKKSGLGGKSFMKKTEKKHPVHAIASGAKAPTNPRVKFASQIDPELKKQLKMKSVETGMKEYEIIEEALKAYF